MSTTNVTLQNEKISQVTFRPVFYAGFVCHNLVREQSARLVKWRFQRWRAFSSLKIFSVEFTQKVSRFNKTLIKLKKRFSPGRELLNTFARKEMTIFNRR